MSQMESFIENYADIFALCWIAFVVIVWLLIRRFRPGILGVGDNFNDQRIDGVKYRPCPSCNDGLLEPQFYKRKRMLGIPPGFIYAIGKPDEYICTKCGNKVNRLEFGGMFTRVSLASSVPLPEAIRTIATFVIVLVLVLLFVIFFLN